MAWPVPEARVKPMGPMIHEGFTRRSSRLVRYGRKAATRTEWRIIAMTQRNIPYPKCFSQSDDKIINVMEAVGNTARPESNSFEMVLFRACFEKVQTV